MQPHAPHPSDVQPAAPSGGDPCVAIAEDDTDLRRLIAQAIRGDGYHVAELRNGTELLEYMAATQLYGLRFPKPALIITDLQMPGFNGLEIIQGLKRARYWAPVILITAFGTHETHQRARHLGVHAVFDKPFDIDELRAEVHKVVPRSGPARH
jgi:DNA-binding response OmpR family regulator